MLVLDIVSKTEIFIYKIYAWAVNYMIEHKIFPVKA